MRCEPLLSFTLLRWKLIASNLIRFQEHWAEGKFHFRSDKWKCRPGLWAQLELFRNRQSRTLRSNFRRNRTPNVLNWPIIYSFEAILSEKLSINHNWMFRTQEEVWGLIFYWLFTRLVLICVINQHRRSIWRKLFFFFKLAQRKVKCCRCGDEQTHRWPISRHSFFSSLSFFFFHYYCKSLTELSIKFIFADVWK